MTRVAILWHMHQPFYQDLLTGEHILPWVRLHGLKDYYGMVALLREFPDVKITFNLVPSLLVQLEAFAAGEARDRHLEIGLKAADALTDDERAFAVEHFFHAHRPRMIDPYPRYAELADKRGRNGGGLSWKTIAAHFSTADLRDLQVWHKLAWLDPYLLDGDARAQRLLAKGRDFTEEDKQTLRAVELELLRRIVPEYRDAARRGQVELSTSPFYHPILPLLCDTDVYLRTHPQSRMPRERFRRSEDAAEQLVRAADYHATLFGARPAGVWPSEGSVSDAMVPLVAAAGFAWMATDEEILGRSRGRPFTRDAGGHVEQPDALYRPYLVGRPGGQVACLFRDHTLSDLIGFHYASWPADAAADDFVRRLVEAGRRFTTRTGGEEATVAVILDGENAWEHYAGQGRPFLRALYGRLSGHSELRTVTMADACARASEPLPSIFPGSWINGDFYIWIGHADDHRAWSQLAEARRALDAPPPGLSDAALRQAREELLVAEGSDWFWWYGDDHSSEHDLAFDDLFRRHVRNVYRALGLPIPEELFVTNITTAPPEEAISRPTGFITPVIDGEVTSYFEWVGAGCVEPAATAGAMHQVSAPEAGLAVIEFGFDLEHLYLRVDSAQRLDALLAAGLELHVNFLKPAGQRIQVRSQKLEVGSGKLEVGSGKLEVGSAGDAGFTVRMLRRGGDGRWQPVEAAGVRGAIGRVAELQVPFARLDAGRGAAVAFFVALHRSGTEVEHLPRHRPIELTVPDREFAAANWTA